MCKGYFGIDNEKKLNCFAFVWVDRDQRYFISNTPPYKNGLPYAWDRFRQVDDSRNENPVCVEFDINQPWVAKIYYSINPKIDESYRTRQDYFQLERRLHTKD